MTIGMTVSMVLMAVWLIRFLGILSTGLALIGFLIIEGVLLVGIGVFVEALAAAGVVGSNKKAVLHYAKQPFKCLVLLCYPL